VARYNKEIADNKKVEFIHVSLDRDENAALAWAKKENFPWHHVLRDQIGKTGLAKYHTSGSVPFYCLIDKSGKLIAKGSSASFSEAKKAVQ
jgi:hypothetical protein